MTASTDILIGDAGGEHVLVRVLSRNHPGLFDRGDENWLTCELHVAAGGFRGGFRADLRTEDFQGFLDEAEGLSRALEGTASFSTMEEQMALTLTGDGRGHVRVRGELVDAPGSDNRLRFSFEIDRSYLPQICNSLEVVLAAFPVVRTTDA